MRSQFSLCSTWCAWTIIYRCREMGMKHRADVWLLWNSKILKYWFRKSIQILRYFKITFLKFCTISQMGRCIDFSVPACTRTGWLLRGGGGAAASNTGDTATSAKPMWPGPQAGGKQSRTRHGQSPSIFRVGRDSKTTQVKSTSGFGETFSGAFSRWFRTHAIGVWIRKQHYLHLISGHCLFFV